MFAIDLRLALAYLSVVAMALVTLEGGIRAARAGAPGKWAARAVNAMLLLIGVTAAAGLALLVQGRQPHQWLHLMCAFLAFGTVVTANAIAGKWSIRTRALATLRQRAARISYPPSTICNRLTDLRAVERASFTSGLLGSSWACSSACGW